MSSFTHVDWGNGLTVTDEGGGAIRVDVCVLRKLVVSWGGQIPSTLGNNLVWRVPYNTDGSSYTFTIAEAFFRVETPNVNPTSIRFETSPGGAVFIPTTLTTLSVSGAGGYEHYTPGLAVVVTSGTLLRMVHTAVAANGSIYQAELVGSQ